MCSPIATLVPIALQAVSGIYQAQQQIAEGKAAQNYYNAVAEQNRQQGDIALRVGQKQSELIQDTAKMQGKQLKESQAEFNATQQAQMAAQGIQGVTAEDIAYSNLNKENLDAAMLRYNADTKSWTTTEQAKYDKYALDVNASNMEFAGKQARAAAKRNAFNTLLGTAASTAFSLGTSGLSLFKAKPSLSSQISGFQNSSMKIGNNRFSQFSPYSPVGRTFSYL